MCRFAFLSTSAPEDLATRCTDDKVLATARFMEVVRDLLARGHPVDRVTHGAGAEPDA